MVILAGLHVVSREFSDEFPGIRVIHKISVNHVKTRRFRKFTQLVLPFLVLTKKVNIQTFTLMSYIKNDHHADSCKS